MAATDVDICNIALGRIRVTTRIESLDDDSTEAAVCKLHYEQARDAMLEEFPWPFATRRSTLAPVSGVTRTGWTYAFYLPEDCLAPRAIDDGALRGARADQLTPFDIESESDGQPGILLCDIQAPELIYTGRVAEVPRFTALFVEALAWHLAAELALALNAKPELETVARQRWVMALAKAKASSLNTRQPDVQPRSEFLTVRG